MAEPPAVLGVDEQTRAAQGAIAPRRPQAVDPDLLQRGQLRPPSRDDRRTAGVGRLYLRGTFTCAAASVHLHGDGSP
jgi:hypothetical protein